MSHPPDGTSTVKGRMIIFRRGVAPWEVSLSQGWPSGGISFTQTLSVTCSGSPFRLLLFSTTSVALFLALFFPQLRVFNNFSALFSGLFSFVFGGRSFVFSNFSALFFKIPSFLSHNCNAKLSGLLFSTDCGLIHSPPRLLTITTTSGHHQHKGYHASRHVSSKISFWRPVTINSTYLQCPVLLWNRKLRKFRMR